MALEANITNSDEFYQGEDKVLRAIIYEDATRAVCVDVDGDDLVYVLALSRGAAPIIEKTTNPGGGIAVAGAFNATPASNAQRVLITIDADETEQIKARMYHHELYRIDAGFKNVFFEGRLTLKQRTRPVPAP